MHSGLIKHRIKLQLKPPLFKLAYGKPYHLPVELEHKAYWVVKALNMDPTIAEEKNYIYMCVRMP